MKIYIDNENPDFRKIACIQSENDGDMDDIETVIDALKAVGYEEDFVKQMFLQKCVDWKFIEKNKQFEEDEDGFEGLR